MKGTRALVANVNTSALIASVPPYPSFGESIRKPYDSSMTQLGKLMIVAGIALALIGAIIFGLGRLGFRGLPGDISVQSDRGSFYFPIVSCLALSLLLTLGMWLWRWISRQ